MAGKRFKKKETDKEQIRKEEKGVNIGKAVVGILTTVGSVVLAVVTKGKFGGSKKG